MLLTSTMPKARQCTVAAVVSTRIALGMTCDKAAASFSSIAHQQNSCLHCEQLMCMQPWFFSMGRLHLGHGLVLAMIQLRFSDSALFLSSHFATVVQSTCQIALPQCILRFSSGSKEDIGCVLNWNGDMLAGNSIKYPFGGGGFIHVVEHLKMHDKIWHQKNSISYFIRHKKAN